MSRAEAANDWAEPGATARVPERGWPTWPSRAAFVEATLLAVLLSAFFLIVYFGANAIAARGGVTYGLYLEAELAIPLVPVFIVPYLSMFVLYLVPVFQLGMGEIRALARRIVLGDVISGAAFVLVPTHLGFVDGEVGGPFGPVYAWVRAHDAPHNLVPSLHVISSSLVALALARAAVLPLRIVYLSWLALIVVSTVLTHRHHLLDVAAGLTVVAIILALTPDRQT